MISVDIAIPTFNERKSIKSCLESILSFKTSRQVLIKIYIIDGGSTDKTQEIIKKHFGHIENLTILDNPKKYPASALNKVITEGEGDYLLRLDAHSHYPADYLEKCLETSLRTNAANVGGLVETISGSHSPGAMLVQALTTHWFGVGNSGFRIGAKEGPVDTVPFGFFQKSIFKEIGLFDERLIRAQDYELNSRINSSGKVVWLNPEIKISYKNINSIKDFYIKQFLLEAPYNAYMWWISKKTFNFRHSITSFFTLGFFGGVILSPNFSLLSNIFSFVMFFYFSLSVLASFQQSKRYGFKSEFLLLPLCFFCFHIIHGVGILKGLLLLALGLSPVQKNL